MAEFPAPEQGIVLTHFIVSEDVERSRRFYTDVLGGQTVLEGEPPPTADRLGAGFGGFAESVRPGTRVAARDLTT